jgi:hypothetical protein
MSNALSKGVPLQRLIEASRPQPGVVSALLHAADGYTDSFAFEKAMDSTTLVRYGNERDGKGGEDVWRCRQRCKTVTHTLRRALA